MHVAISLCVIFDAIRQLINVIKQKLFFDYNCIFNLFNREHCRQLSGSFEKKSRTHIIFSSMLNAFLMKTIWLVLQKYWKKKKIFLSLSKFT